MLYKVIVYRIADYLIVTTADPVLPFSGQCGSVPCIGYAQHCNTRCSTDLTLTLTLRLTLTVNQKVTILLALKIDPNPNRYPNPIQQSLLLIDIPIFIRHKVFVFYPYSFILLHLPFLDSDGPTVQFLGSTKTTALGLQPVFSQLWNK